MSKSGSSRFMVDRFYKVSVYLKPYQYFFLHVRNRLALNASAIYNM